MHQIPVSGQTTTARALTVAVSKAPLQQPPASTPYCVVVLPDTEAPRVELFTSFEPMAEFVSEQVGRDNEVHVVAGNYCPVMRHPGSARIFLKTPDQLLHELSPPVAEFELQDVAAMRRA